MFKKNNVKAYEKALENYLKAMKALEEDGLTTNISINQKGDDSVLREVSEINNKLFKEYFAKSNSTYNGKEVK